MRLETKATKTIEGRHHKVGDLTRLTETLMKAVPQAADGEARRRVVIGALLQVYEAAYADARASAVKDASAQLGGFQETVRLLIEQLCRREIGLSR